MAKTDGRPMLTDAQRIRAERIAEAMRKQGEASDGRRHYHQERFQQWLKWLKSVREASDASR